MVIGRDSVEQFMLGQHSSGRPLRIGVLALQGSFAEHMIALDKIGIQASKVRNAYEVEHLDGLIIPGGESTTLAKLIDIEKMRDSFFIAAKKGMAIWGTCAGLIILAKELTELYPEPLGLIDATVTRNWFGRQKESFEEDLTFVDENEAQFRGIFIRAPSIRKIGEKVTPLAYLPDGQPVAIRSGNVLGTTFHPELTDDYRFHATFAKMAAWCPEDQNQNMERRLAG